MDNFESRRVVLDLAVSLDGFIEGPNGETDWCIMDEDMNFNDFLNGIDAIFYGRKSYELWGQYAPEENASDMEKEMWELLHSKKKYVFSKSMKEDRNDRNVTIISVNIVDEVGKIKKEPGKDIWLYGGASLITTFIDKGLIDEYRLSVHPVVLGAGKPLFIDIKERLNLKLINSRKFTSGVVQLCYEPVEEIK